MALTMRAWRRHLSRLLLFCCCQ